MADENSIEQAPSHVQFCIILILRSSGPLKQHI